MGWLWPILGFAQTPHLSQLLRHADPITQDNIVFVLQGAQAASISELRLHFLTGEDCYSGYLAGNRVGASDTPFSLGQNQPFELTGKGIYQTARIVLNANDLSQVQSLLIRFVDRHHGQRYQQFSRFTGSCQDQDINCCIPITCSVNAGICAAKYAVGMQPIAWL